MDSKALLFPLLLIFCIIIPFSAQENVTVSVKSVTTIAETDENFICATLDWWPKEKCNYGSCPWGNSSVLNLDLENPILHNAIKALNPLRIRIGGSLQDSVIYKVGRTRPMCHNLRKYKHENDGLFGFSTGCLTMCRWDQLNAFFNETGAKIIFGLNALIGRKKSVGDLYVGDWDTSNAKALMNYTATKGYEIEAWELGNELSGSGVIARVEAEQYGRDALALKALVNEVYKGSPVKPMVFAPGGFYDKVWFDQMLQTTGPGVVDGLTHHIYNLGPGNDPELIHKIQDPYYLNRIAQTFKEVVRTINIFSPSSGAWISEAGGAYNSGGIGVSDAYVNSFWYLDQLGMTSTFDHKAYCRQALVGGHYSLLKATTFVPNPDYYSALLWHKLMGGKVLQTTHYSSPYLRAYAHCSKYQNGITVLLINGSNSTTFNVSLTNDLNLNPSGYSASEGDEQGEREVYHLTPKGGDIHSHVMLLNGLPLQLTSALEVPEMNPVMLDSGAPLCISPLSISFVTFKDFNAPACS